MYTLHVICQDIDGACMHGATEADGGTSAPVGPSVATATSLGESTILGSGYV